MKILFFYTDLIEGSRLNHQLTQLLSPKNWQCEMAFDHKEFQEKFNRLAPDAIIFDLDGNEQAVIKFNKIIKEKFPHILRIMVSAELGREELKRHQKTADKAHGYMVRPLKPEFVQMVLEDMTKVKRSEDALVKGKSA